MVARETGIDDLITLRRRARERPPRSSAKDRHNCEPSESRHAFSGEHGKPEGEHGTFEPGYRRAWQNHPRNWMA